MWGNDITGQKLNKHPEVMQLDTNCIKKISEKVFQKSGGHRHTPTELDFELNLDAIPRKIYFETNICYIIESFDPPPIVTVRGKNDHTPTLRWYVIFKWPQHEKYSHFIFCREAG